MKVFLSWSGEISHKEACVFRDWLPSVLQFVDPYVSSEDIDKGTRWSTDIANELEQSSYGILIVTKDNIEAPWLIFEAGALSKSLENARVSPFLYNMKSSELTGPLLQFQSTIFSEDDIFKLLSSINQSADVGDRLDDPRLKKAFDVWWPELKQHLDDIPKSKVVASEVTETISETDQSAILEELLALIRDQTRLLNDPERLMPRGYLEHVLVDRTSMVSKRMRSEMHALRKPLVYIERNTKDLQNLIEIVRSKNNRYLNKMEFEELTVSVNSIDGAIQHALDIIR